MMMTLKLLRAGRRNVERGWCQNVMYKRQNDTVTAVCALGGISLEAQRLSISSCSAIQALEEATPYNGIVPYNDAPGRTKEEVLHIYDKAILREQVKEMERQANANVMEETV